MTQYIQLRVKRQDTPNAPSFWEEFAIAYSPNMNIVSTLMEIRKKPVTKDGKATTPVVWDCSCLEEVCGACSMIINGTPRQACSALVDSLEQPVVLEPLSKFPLVRDLMVNRDALLESFKKVKAWVENDDSYNLGPKPKFKEVTNIEVYKLSLCMSCGCCLEACPNVNAKSAFIGPAALNQVRLFNEMSFGKLTKSKRLASIIAEDGISNCHNSQNCAQVCPKKIPLTSSIAMLKKETNRQWFKKLKMGKLMKTNST